MKKEALEEKLNHKLQKRFGDSVRVSVEGRIIRVSGHMSRWEDIVEACSMCVVGQGMEPRQVRRGEAELTGLELCRSGSEPWCTTDLPCNRGRRPNLSEPYLLT